VEILAGAPAQAISFLGPRLKIVAPATDVKKIAALIAKLDDDNFTEREAASAELQKIGQEAAPQLRRALTETKSAEVRERAQEILAKFGSVSLTADQKRLQAVLYVFELIASDEARKVLSEVAQGNSGTWLAAQAEAALKRIR
jgi:hypothetical protein